jgi:hypothetical protein
MSLIAGWAIHYANKTRDAWLIRILVIEGIFLVHFTAWYLGRYLPQLPRPGIGIMAALVFGLSVLVVGLGLLRDRKRSSQGESAASQD